MVGWLGLGFHNYRTLKNKRERERKRYLETTFFVSGEAGGIVHHKHAADFRSVFFLLGTSPKHLA